MAEFKVNTDRISAQVSSISSVQGSLAQISSQLGSIKISSVLKSGAAESLNRRIKECSSSVGKLSGSVSSLSTVLSSVSAEYRNCETSLTEPKTAAQAANHTGGSGNGSGSGSITPTGSGTEAGTTSSSTSSGSDKDPIQMPHFKREVGIGMGSIAAAGTFAGIHTNGSASWGGPGASIDASYSSISGEAHVAKGSVSGDFGYLHGEGNAYLGKAYVKGGVTASLWDKGKFKPQLQAKAEAGGAVVNGDASARIGTETNNIHAKAEGSLLTASASASGGAGVISYKDASGNEVTGYGLEGSVGAEAYLAKGKVSGGFSIFGIKIDASVTGGAGGASAKAGGHIGTGSIGGTIGAGLGIGGEISINIDWSNFKWGW